LARQESFEPDFGPLNFFILKLAHLPKRLATPGLGSDLYFKAFKHAYKKTLSACVGAKKSYQTLSLELQDILSKANWCFIAEIRWLKSNIYNNLRI
jgi:hypothetical protein